jgi:hypothetical protein
MNRTLKVVRMQFVNRSTFIWLPLIILGASWAMSVAIFAMIPYDGAKYGGGSQAPIWYFFALGIMALSYSFPFSQALSVTRREFFLGTMLTAIVTSVLLGVAFVIGGALEQATRGWGVNGYFFYLDWVWRSGPLVAGLFYAALALLLFVLGFWGATIHRRFGPLGLTVSLVAIGVVLVALVWGITQLGVWPQVGAWMAGLDALALAGSILLATVVLAGGSFLTLRRAVPA